MKKIVALLMLCGTFLVAQINLQTASKEELMSIKGIGEKKAEQIMEYRKKNTIKNPEDLKNIKGFGDSIVGNVKESGKTSKEKTEKKVQDKKEEKKKELNKAVDKKIEKTTGALVPKL
ncbi:ComEA family DNA-binding protein [Arcobacter aquimarinus]|uniref:Competence protein, ComEA family n=1 Tax=Arcobacter aquimarinus TaxID=1315211 RepID=A0AAE7B469_9BACT|nr:helix-hairpin-helix domain-containing protein [Arcobacter aquimarinus]QKE27168.1 competence protein, ComEA family [Arcobacter aquimarinus]RXI35158.1 competence protein ComEA [Arcobacter aquimarinus]